MDIDQITAGITWHPLVAIPDDRMDGRDVLLWKGAVIVGSYLDGWCDPVGRPVEGATHFADAQGPGL
jgi:hypothetical protein